MNISATAYSNDRESFYKNIKFSCHCYLVECVLDLEKSTEKIKSNAFSLNEPDLYGKYNSINFLLDLFLFYQNHKFGTYPEGRQPTIDFHYLVHNLIEAGANIYSIDYNHDSVLNNVEKILSCSAQWQKKHIFITEKTPHFIESSTEVRLQSMNDMLKHGNIYYQHIYLQTKLENKEYSNKKHKI